MGVKFGSMVAVGVIVLVGIVVGVDVNVGVDVVVGVDVDVGVNVAVGVLGAAAAVSIDACSADGQHPAVRIATASTTIRNRVKNFPCKETSEKMNNPW